MDGAAFKEENQIIIPPGKASKREYPAHTEPYLGACGHSNVIGIALYFLEPLKFFDKV